MLRPLCTVGRRDSVTGLRPFGQPGVPAVASFDATYENVDLAAFTDVLELDGIRLAGRACGRNLLEWPLGRFSDHRGDGEIRLEPPAGVGTMSRFMTASQIEDAEQRGREWGPFDAQPLSEPVPIAGNMIYAYGPEWVDFGVSHLATPETYVELRAAPHTAIDRGLNFTSRAPTGRKAIASLPACLTAFGSRTGVISIGGYGTFDGVMVNNFRRPRIEGAFRGERIRAFDVVWGSTTGRAVIENAYADVASVAVLNGDSAIHVDGRFSLGFPRRDGGEEINARIRVIRQAHRRSSSCLRARRVRRGRIVLGRVPCIRRISRAIRLRSDGNR